MSYPINYPTPQGANIQIFQEGGTTSDWVKPQGASFVWFTLIGAGGGSQAGDGSNGTGGSGSGAVTNCMVPAFLIPDVLRVVVGLGGAGGASSGASGTAGGQTSIVYQAKDSTGYTLLSANGGGAGTSGGAGSGASAMTANYFSCMGFFQSVAGQSGAFSPTSVSASSTTFLSGGASPNGGTVSVNYGYPTSATNSGDPGFFQMQPIIVSRGGTPSTGSFSANANGRGGVGSGGAGCVGSVTDNSKARGGDGLVVIITW
jgi:hypothetical protein